MTCCNECCIGSCCAGRCSAGAGGMGYGNGIVDRYAAACGRRAPFTSVALYKLIPDPLAPVSCVKKGLVSHGRRIEYGGCRPCGAGGNDGFASLPQPEPLCWRRSRAARACVPEVGSSGANESSVPSGACSSMTPLPWAAIGAARGTGTLF